MIKYLTALTLAALLTASPAATQEPEPPSREQVMADYGTLIEDAGLTISVVHLNDQSVEALFTAPTKYALRVQAQQATMFYVQGTNERPLIVQPDLGWQIRQGDDVLSARVVSISNFEERSNVQEGEEYSGLVVADGLVDPSEAFTVENGEYAFDFAFSSSQVDLIEGR